MAKDLVILDSSAAVSDQKGVLPGVMNFLKTQSRSEWLTKTRECIMTCSPNENKKGIAEISKQIKLFYSTAWLNSESQFQYRIYSDELAILSKNMVHADRRMSPQRSVPYQNPFIAGKLKKDLHLVRNLYVNDGEKQYLRILEDREFASCRVHPTQRALFIGNRENIDCSITDPTIPNIIIADETWAKRKSVEAVTDKLFEDNPPVVFDQLFASGEAVVNYREAAKSVEVHIENFRFRMSKLVDGLEARLIEELI